MKLLRIDWAQDVLSLAGSEGCGQIYTPPAGKGNGTVIMSRAGLLGLNQGEPFDCLEITVTANERCAQDEGSCGDPEVVLI
jgi:hypothetical protein